jgi:hypothetical protein
VPGTIYTVTYFKRGNSSGKKNSNEDDFRTLLKLIALHRQAPRSAGGNRFQPAYITGFLVGGHAGAITLLAAFVMILRAWFERWTTEVLVTDRRAEINMDKIDRNTRSYRGLTRCR